MEDVLAVYAQPHDPRPCPRPASRPARTGRLRGQRIRPVRHLLDLRVGRALSRVAPCARPGPANQDRLGRAGQTTADRGLSRRRDRGAGHGQSQHPRHRLALRGIRIRRGIRSRPAPGDPPHPQTRVLAQHRRDRVVRTVLANASTAASATSTPSTPNSPPGNTPSTQSIARSAGSSLPTTHASHSATRRIDQNQNIPLSFAEVFGTSWITSQCSTTLPSSRRK